MSEAERERYIAELKGFGAPDEVIAEELREEIENDVFEVHEDNWQTVLAFCALATQWHRRRIEEGERWNWIYEGLRYPAIPMALEVVNVQKRDRRTVLVGLQIMERAAMKVLNAAGEEEGSDE